MSFHKWENQSSPLCKPYLQMLGSEGIPCREFHCMHLKVGFLPSLLADTCPESGHRYAHTQGNPLQGISLSMSASAEGGPPKFPASTLQTYDLGWGIDMCIRDLQCSTQQCLSMSVDCNQMCHTPQKMSVSSLESPV